MIEAQEGSCRLHLLPLFLRKGSAHRGVQSLEGPLAAALTRRPVYEVGVIKVHRCEAVGEAAAESFHEAAVSVETRHREG